MEKLGLYFHIPFCNSKCFYCDFDSSVKDSNEKKQYITALKKEIDLAIKKYDLNKYIIDTVFIGGGTPSCLDENLLQQMLEYIENNFNLDKDYEYSIEINPNSIKDEKIAILTKSKVNRISIGLQSTDDTYLKVLGRTHNFDEFVSSYNKLRKSGFDNINIDLIMGIPSQSLDSYKKNLDTIISLKPEHISAYMLIIEENTPFFNMLEKGLIQIDDELTVKMYEYTIKFLEKNGYYQYEISNFAKKDDNKDYRCKHNIKYWKVENYLGFGQSAHSYLNNKRFSNLGTKYIESLKNNKLPINDEHIQTKQDLYEENIFLRLRMNEGIDIESLNRKFDMDFAQKYKKQLLKMYKNGLIKDYKNGNLSLTTRGILVSNQIFVELI